jgi:hypothetical protein
MVKWHRQGIMELLKWIPALLMMKVFQPGSHLQALPEGLFDWENLGPTVICCQMRSF